GDSSHEGETRDRASRKFTLARKAIPICEPCWCKGRSTFWGRLVRTAALGPEAGRAGRKKRQEAGHHCHGKKAGGVAASLMGERRSLRTIAPQRWCGDAGRRLRSPFETKWLVEPCNRKQQSPKPSSRDCR